MPLASTCFRPDNIPVMDKEQITTTYLEMSDPADLRTKRVSLEGLEIRKVEIVSPEFNWFLHQAVGAAFRWGGREDWGRAEWAAYAVRPELETWVAYVKGAPAGYFELEQHEDGGVEILYFGIMARHFGQGIVRSTDNFGRLGSRPSHQALLDWLASMLAEEG